MRRKFTPDPGKSYARKQPRLPPNQRSLWAMASHAKTRPRTSKIRPLRRMGPSRRAGPAGLCWPVSPRIGRGVDGRERRTWRRGLARVLELGDSGDRRRQVRALFQPRPACSGFRGGNITPLPRWESIPAREPNLCQSKLGPANFRSEPKYFSGILLARSRKGCSGFINASGNLLFDRTQKKKGDVDEKV